MTLRRVLPLALGFLLFGTLFSTPARADEANREIHFTINEPIEIPGVVLPAGSYDLKLEGFGSTVAGVWNIRGNRFYGFFDTIPVDRVHSSRTKVDLSESIKGAPERLTAWFYPGDKQGNEILYPPAKNVEMASSASSNQLASR
jgi:hypothetical protein